MANKPLDPKCPRCGGPCGKAGVVSDRRGKTGTARWQCRDHKGCKWIGVQAIGKDKSEAAGLDAAHIARRHKKIKGDSRPVRRYVITAAQNATDVHKPFLESLLSYCAINGCELIVIPYRYKNPTSFWSGKAQHDDWWAHDLHPYLLDRRINLNQNIVVLADIKTQPTADSPLQGFETITGGRSAVIGHPKIELTTIPTPQNKLPKILTTTGAVTRPNYIPSKAGKKGEHHHTYAACLVEVKSNRFHVRQLIASSDGTFCDLTWKYWTTGRTPSEVEVLAMGDTHHEFIDPGVVKATFTAKDSIINTLKPKRLIWHDVYDCYARNHHERNDVFVNLVKHRTGAGNVERGLDGVFAFVDKFTRPGQTNVFVTSNHPNGHLTRWVKETDPRSDLENCVFWAETFVAMADSARMTKSGAEVADPFYYWAKRKLKTVDQAVFLDPDQSYTVKGVELGSHGHLGANGARGTRSAYGKIGVKTIIGHSHSPGIKDGALQVGTNSRLRLSYNHGPSSWMHADAVIYENGKRSLIFIVGDEWRA